VIIIIIVDVREPNDIINEIKKSIKDFKSDFIEVGDYLLPNGFAIERKTGKDLIHSIQDGRLFQQLNNLCQFDHPTLAIVTDNIWRDMFYSRNKNIPSVYIGTLTTITAKYPSVNMVFLDSDGEFIKYVISLHKKLTDEGSSERPAPVMRKAKSFRVVMENGLCAVKGISVKSAKKILHHFDSIENLCCASIEDIKTVEGIGLKQAESVHKFLHGSYNSNGHKKKNGKR